MKDTFNLTSKKLNTVLDSLDTNIYLADIETGKILFANQKMIQNFGEPEHLQNILFLNKTIESAKRKYLSTIEHTEAYNFTSSYKGKSYESKIKVIQLKRGFKCFLHTLNELSEQIETQKIEKADSAFKQIFESFPIGISILDRSNRLIDLNKVALEIFGIYESSDIIGKNIADYVSLKRHRSSYSSGNEDDKNKFSFVNKNGHEVIILKKEVPIILANENVLLELYINITDIEAARKGEEIANKGKTMFLAKISHEIRNPLNGVIGMSEALLNSNLGSEQHEFAYFIKKSADMLLSLINDVLDFSKIEAGKMVLEEIPFNLREEISLAADSFRFTAKEKGVNIFHHFDNQLPEKVIGDPFRLKQIINNLVGNALKFTHEGKILVSVELVKFCFGRITILCTIEDTGIGIAKNKLNDIFSSFSQAEGSTTRKYGGTGLGTTISKQLIEMMDGEIWVESPSSLSTNAKYPGSKFSFTVELTAEEKFEKDIDRDSITSLSKLRILIADDLVHKQSILKDGFEKFGVQLTVCKEEDQILHILKNQYIKAKRCHIVFIEDAPDYNGLKIAQAMNDRDLSDNYVIIFITSNDKPDKYTKARRQKVDHYLVKPYPPNAITDIIKENFPNIILKPEEIIGSEKLREDINILVAEDSIIGQKVAQTIFKTIGYQIDIAENGNKVLEKIKEKKYDVIFMDNMMPEKDGVQATKELRELGYHMPIIAMTGNVTEEDRKIAAEVGMDEYITKPVVIDAVKKILMKWFTA